MIKLKDILTDADMQEVTELVDDVLYQGLIKVVDMEVRGEISHLSAKKIIKEWLSKNPIFAFRLSGGFDA